MILMWASFALLTLIALLFVMLPFLKKERVKTITHNANAELISIYEQRLVELQNDLENQRIDAQNHSESVMSSNVVYSMNSLQKSHLIAVVIIVFLP